MDDKNVRMRVPGYYLSNSNSLHTTEINPKMKKDDTSAFLCKRKQQGSRTFTHNKCVGARSSLTTGTETDRSYRLIWSSLQKLRPLQSVLLI